MAAGDPNNPTPSLQDIINLSNVSPAPAQSANVPPIPMANPEVPQPPTLTNTPLAPALAGPSSPQSLAGPQALAPSAPSESQAQSNAAATPSNNLKAPALPPTAPGSATGLAAPPPPPPSFMDKLKGAAKGVGEGVLGATGLGAFAPGANATPMQKGQAIMGLLGKIGNAGVMATGSPQQKEQAIQLQGQQNQLLQMQNEAAYRRGMLGNTAQANAIKEATEQGKFGTGAPGVTGTEQQKQQIAQQKANDAMRVKGYVPEEGSPGAFRPMTSDEILRDPMMSQNLEMKNAATAASQAKADLDKATTAGKTNPNSLTQQNIVAALQQKKHQADAQLALAAMHMQQQQTSQNMAGRRDMFNLGTNTQTGEQLGPGNATPGQLLDANGQPVPFRAMSQFAPTSQMKNVSAQAKLAAGQIPDIIKEVHDLGDSLGPVAGRWNEFMQGKVGTDNPAFAGLRADLMMQGTAVALAHARGRLPENLRQEFDTMINSPQQSPANIISVLTHIQPWLEKAGAMSEQPINTPHVAPKGGTTGGSPSSGLAVSLSKARSLPEMKGKSDADITAAIKAQGHTVKP